MKDKSKQKKISETMLLEIAKQFGVLADASRLRILRELMQGSRTVTEIVESTGLKQGNVSKHLAVLQAANFVSREAQGNFAIYSIAEKKIYQLCELMCDSVSASAEKKIRAL